MEGMNEFWHDTDVRVGLDKLPPRVGGGRYALCQAYLRGDNPYLSPSQYKDLEDYGFTDLMEIERMIQ